MFPCRFQKTVLDFACYVRRSFLSQNKSIIFPLDCLTAGVLVSQPAGRGDIQTAEEPKQKTKGKN